jgi:hypothetical protein
MDFLNAFALLANFVIVPGITYGCQLALGALGVTLIYGILRFSNFAHGETMAIGTMATILFTWWLQSLGVSFGPFQPRCWPCPPALWWRSFWCWSPTGRCTGSTAPSARRRSSSSSHRSA